MVCCVCVLCVYERVERVSESVGDYYLVDIKQLIRGELTHKQLDTDGQRSRERDKFRFYLARIWPFLRARLLRLTLATSFRLAFVVVVVVGAKNKQALFSRFLRAEQDPLACSHTHMLACNELDSAWLKIDDEKRKARI